MERPGGPTILRIAALGSQAPQGRSRHDGSDAAEAVLISIWCRSSSLSAAILTHPCRRTPTPIQPMSAYATMVIFFVRVPRHRPGLLSRHPDFGHLECQVVRKASIGAESLDGDGRGAPQRLCYLRSLMPSRKLRQQPAPHPRRKKPSATREGVCPPPPTAGLPDADMGEGMAVDRREMVKGAAAGLGADLGPRRRRPRGPGGAGASWCWRPRPGRRAGWPMPARCPAR